MRRGRGSPALFAFLLVLALVVVGVGLVMTSGERALSASTEGRVVSGQTDDLSSGGQRCRATVAYEVDGREWRTTGIVPGACPSDAGDDGDTVAVRYDPGTPYVAELGDPDQGPLGLTIVAGVLAVAAAVALGLSVVARRRARTGRGPGGPPPSGLYDRDAPA